MVGIVHYYIFPIWYNCLKCIMYENGISLCFEKTNVKAKTSAYKNNSYFNEFSYLF